MDNIIFYSFLTHITWNIHILHEFFKVRTNKSVAENQKIHEYTYVPTYLDRVHTYVPNFQDLRVDELRLYFMDSIKKQKIFSKLIPNRVWFICPLD